MVYGYNTNKEFIDKSYQLLEKLKKKGLQNRDTLVIGLDKSVRPLAYALKKISDVEGKKKPNIKYLDYSSHYEIDKEEIVASSSQIKEQISPSKLSHYKKILALDEHVSSGNSMKNVKKFMEHYFIDSKNKPEINLTCLGLSEKVSKKLNKENFIFIDENLPEGGKNSAYTGIKNLARYERNLSDDEWNLPVPIKTNEGRKEFIQNRHQLSEDIKNYIREKHPEKIKEKSKTLEKIISGIFLFSFLGGLFFSSENLTGNIIGNSGTEYNLIGIILILIGIIGFFIYT